VAQGFDRHEEHVPGAEDVLVVCATIEFQSALQHEDNHVGIKAIACHHRAIGILSVGKSMLYLPLIIRAVEMLFRIEHVRVINCAHTITFLKSGIPWN
jgi:hypothetical protein